MAVFLISLLCTPCFGSQRCFVLTAVHTSIASLQYVDKRRRVTAQLRLSHVPWHLLCRQSRTLDMHNTVPERSHPENRPASPEKPKRRGKTLASRWIMFFLWLQGMQIKRSRLPHRISQLHVLCNAYQYCY